MRGRGLQSGADLERGPVHLPGRRAGQRVRLHAHPRRHHVPRAAGRRRSASPRPAPGPRRPAGTTKATRSCPSRSVRHRHHAGLPHPVVGVDRRLHLAQLHPVAAHLHLVVAAAAETVLPSGSVSTRSPVRYQRPPSGSVANGGRGALRIAPVPGGDRRAADEQLARRRLRAAGPRPGDRAAQGFRSARDRRRRGPRRASCGPCRRSSRVGPYQLCSAAPGTSVAELPQVRRGEDLAGEHDVAQRREHRRLHAALRDPLMRAPRAPSTTRSDPCRPRTRRRRSRTASPRRGQGYSVPPTAAQAYRSNTDRSKWNGACALKRSSPVSPSVR